MMSQNLAGFSARVAHTWKLRSITLPRANCQAMNAPTALRAVISHAMLPPRPFRALVSRSQQSHHGINASGPAARGRTLRRRPPRDSVPRLFSAKCRLSFRINLFTRRTPNRFPARLYERRHRVRHPPRIMLLRRGRRRRRRLWRGRRLWRRRRRWRLAVFAVTVGGRATV